jgi:hypothetical protein
VIDRSNPWAAQASVPGPGQNLICVAWTLARKPLCDVIRPQVLRAVSLWPVRPAGTRCAVWRQVGVENCRALESFNQGGMAFVVALSRAAAVLVAKAR